MITKEQVQKLINDLLKGTDMFVVDIDVKANNVINVYADSYTPFTIDRCVLLNRTLEKSLDREKEDFELNVSSPGLDMPLKHYRQYKKNIGRQIDVLLKDGSKLIGKIILSDDISVTIETIQIVKEGGKKKEIRTEQYILFENIKHTKVIVAF